MVVIVLVLAVVGVREVVILQWPLKNPHITQGFAYNLDDPLTERGTIKGHEAIDISAGYGEPVMAVALGIVLGKNTRECPNFSDPDCNFG
jgi:murein DD-endopeptidase MepM/ murein hydrolase activator NlpD